MNPETTKLIIGVIMAFITVGVLVWIFMMVMDALSPKNIVKGIAGGIKQAGKEVINVGKDAGQAIGNAAKPVGKAVKSVVKNPKEIKKGASSVGKKIKKLF